eukprot:106470-Amorphochlora_amoeboformis.AAC.1
MGAYLSKEVAWLAGKEGQRALKLITFYLLMYKFGSLLHRKRLSHIHRWRGHVSPTVIRFSANALQWASYWGVATLILSRVSGVRTTKIISQMFGVGGIAFGFAAQQTVSNLISGIMLLLSQPFAVGDHIHVPRT